MNYSPLVERISGEGSQAWDIHAKAVADKAAGADIILLSVGDPDLSTPSIVTDAAAEAMRAGDTHYVPVLGTDRLREAIARHHCRTGGLDVTADNVCVTAGAQNGLFFAAQLVLQPGDEVLIPDPCYVTYEATVRATGAVPVAVPSRAETGFRPDPAAMEKRITPRTRAIFLTSPNNPTGTVTNKAEAAAISEIAKAHDLWVVSDEVYASLTYGDDHVSMAALPGMAERTLTVSSLSKSHAMTGWRCGWMIGPAEAIRHASNLSLCMLYGLPGFVQQAGIAALDNAEQIAGEMRSIFMKRRAVLLTALADAPGVKAHEPDAGMFLMVDIRGTGLSANDFAWRLLDEAGVAVLDATAFGQSAQGCVRLSFTIGEDRLAEAGRRIARFCETLAARSQTGSADSTERKPA